MKFKPIAKIIGCGLLFLLKVLSGSVYGLLMIVAFGLLYLVVTQNGTALLIKSATRLAPTIVTIERVEGRLFDRVSLHGVKIELSSGQYAADQVSLEWRLPRLLIGQLSIRELVLINASVSLPEKEDNGAKQEPFSLDLSWLDDIRIRWPFTLALEKFDASNTVVSVGDNRYLIEHFQMGTALTDGRLVFRTNELQAVGAEIDGKIQITGGPGGRLQLDGDVNWSYSGAPWPLAGHLRVEGGVRKLNLVHKLSHPVEIESEIELALMTQLPTVISHHHWAKLCWPEFSTDLCLQQGELDFQFEDNLYAMRLATHVIAPAEQPFPLVGSSDVIVKVSSNGRVDLNALGITATVDYQLDSGVAGPWQNWQGTLALDAEPTVINVKTKLNLPLSVSLEGNALQQDSRWVANGQVGVLDFNPGIIIPSVPGLIIADVAFKGHAGANSWGAEIDLKKLTGHLLEEPIHGSGGISVNKDQWVAKNFSLKAYGMELALSGKLDPNANGKIDLALAIPDLHLYSPDLAGKALINAHIKGSLAHPELTLDGRVTSLKTSAGEWQEIHLLAGGSLVAHHAQLKFKGEPEGSLSLNGQWQEGKWKGELQTLQAASHQVGEWMLSAPVQIQWSPEAWKTEQLCFEATKNRVCAQGSGTAELAEGEFSVDWEDFKSIRALLPKRLRLNTQLNATGNIRFSATDGLSGVVQASTREGNIRWFSGDNGMLKMPVRLHNLEVSLSPTQLEAAYDLRVDKDEVATGKFVLTAPKETPFKYDTLSGGLRGGLARFDWLQFFVPQIEDMQGEMIWDIAVAGPLTAPQMRGNIKYLNGQLSLPDLGQIDLPLLFDVSLEGSHLELLARVDSAQRGSLSVQGKADFPTLSEWTAKGQLMGDNFLVIDTAEYQARVTPNLKVSAQPGALTVTGVLAVPAAQINFRGLPAGGVTISNDVIVIRENQPPTTRNILIADITVKAGDHVYFKGMGLDGRVTGSARYLRRPNGLQELFGDLGIRDGIYRAFGYNLEIERGTVIFAGSPTNPGLDISAERRLLSGEKIPVLISGSLQEPVLTLPQSSDQSQGDAFSKLLTGRNVGEGGQGEGILTDQVAMMGVGLAENVTQGFAQSLGFDSGGLRAEDGLESTSLYLGKQVTERLFVGYGIGLVTPEQTVNLRLTLDKNWSVEATSGREGGIDLIYNYETRAATTRSQKIDDAATDDEEELSIEQ